MKFFLASIAILSAGVSAFSISKPNNNNSASSSRITTITRTTTAARTTTTTSLSASGGGMSVRPIGIGSASPQTLITNVDLESVHDTSDEWIRSRTGIQERRVLVHEGTRSVITATNDDDDEGGTIDAEIDETLRTLGIEAARNALDMARIDPADIDLVICATSSPDDLFGDAPSIAHAVGCDSARVVAFDLTAACSGFLFGIVTASQFLSNGGGSARKALVLGADALTRWVDWEDRNSCILFGDGAGAMVLSSSDDDDDDDDDDQSDGIGILGYSMHSNGGGYKELKCIYRGEPRKISTPGDGTVVHDGSYDLMTMNGRKVYSFATREVPTVLKEALDNAGISVDDVDHLLLHQANIRIMEVVADRLGMPMEKVITNLYKYGNTSAASIPLALDDAVRSGRVKKGDVIACAGFGAGLSWGAAILKWG